MDKTLHAPTEISVRGLYCDGFPIMGLHNDNMLLSPYQDLNGHIKCNVIFETVFSQLDVI